MKDIDFDELDRAVSSVLGQQTPKADESVGVTKTTTETVQATIATEPVSQATTEESPTSEPAVASPAGAAPSLAVKRRGRFMDVMPAPGKTPSAPATEVQPVRTRPVIAPLSKDVTPEAVSEVETPAEPQLEPTAKLDESQALIGAEPAPVENLLPDHTEEPSEPVSTETEESAKDEPAEVAAETPAEPTDKTENSNSLYIDPLELTEKKDEPEAASEPIEPQASVTTPAITPTEPKVTPFIPDAQVDKRPLGSFGTAETPNDVPAESEEAAVPAAPAAVAQDAAPAVALPRELQPDVVQVEAVAQEAEASTAAPAQTAPMAKADDGRVEGHPLFDTTVYHEPIAAVHGKGIPGWVKWLLGLLVCLALGAGVGYFLFTAGL